MTAYSSPVNKKTEEKHDRKDKKIQKVQHPSNRRFLKKKTENMEEMKLPSKLSKFSEKKIQETQIFRLKGPNK